MSLTGSNVWYAQRENRQQGRTLRKGNFLYGDLDWRRIITDQEHGDQQYMQENNADQLGEQEREAQRLALRENTKRVLRESGLAEMLLAANKNLLKGRGQFEEYDAIVLFKWGTSHTRRHIWVEVDDNTIRFRLLQHRRCTSPVPLCDGEYHTFTKSMWANRVLLQSELKKYYDRPVAESSSD